MQNKPVKRIPERHCVGCNAARPKSELIRVVRCPNGVVSIDFKGKMSGRGVYICPSPECLRKAIKTRRLENNLNITIPDEILEELTAVIKIGEENGQ